MGPEIGRFNTRAELEEKVQVAKTIKGSSFDILLVAPRGSECDPSKMELWIHNPAEKNRVQVDSQGWRRIHQSDFWGHRSPEPYRRMHSGGGAWGETARGIH